MSDEHPMRALLRDEADGTGEIDLARVLKRTRARRRPKVALVAAGGVLACAAVVTPVTFAAVNGVFSPGVSTLAGSGEADQAPEAAGSTDTGYDQGATGITDTVVPAPYLTCGSALVDVQSASGVNTLDLGLVLDAPERTLPAGTPTTLTAHLTAVDVAALGSTASGAVVSVLEDGVVVAQTAAIDSSLRIIDLAPGESLELPAELDPSGCSTVGSTLQPGAYEVVASVTFVDQDGGPTLLVSAPEPLRLG